MDFDCQTHSQTGPVAIINDMTEFLQQKVKVDPDVLFQEVNGETVLLNLKNESYFGLDATGTRVWQLLHEQDEIMHVFKTMLEEYDVDEKQLEQDLRKLIADMEEAELIVISNK